MKATWMMALNFVGGVVILLANLVISYNHSIELFRSGGFSGWMAHVAVIGTESVFLLGVFNLVDARLRGRSPDIPAILAGILGVFIVGWSNVKAGWEYGKVGITLGAVVPASMIIAEANLARTIMRIMEATKENLEVASEEPPEVSTQQAEAPQIEVEEITEEPPDPLEVARRIWRKKKKLPTIREIMEVGDCSEWYARKARRMLKEELQIN